MHIDYSVVVFVVVSTDLCVCLYLFLQAHDKRIANSNSFIDMDNTIMNNKQQQKTKHNNKNRPFLSFEIT